jgi:hypothetical protein
VAELEVRIMVFLLHFLGEADADTVEPDAAIDVLESVADWLQRAPADERAAFLARLDHVAADERRPVDLRLRP